MTEEKTSPTPAPLRIKYTAPDGTPTDLVLGDKPITIGRSPDADICTLDERASRMHSGIRLWDGEYYLKDLKSKNGTFLNNERVEMHKIKPGDKIRLGTSVLSVEDKDTPGTETTMANVQEEMDEGKGYKTILREIVEDVEPEAKPTPPPPPMATIGSGEASENPAAAGLDSKAIKVKPKGAGARRTPIKIKRQK